MKSRLPFSEEKFIAKGMPEAAIDQATGYAGQDDEAMVHRPHVNPGQRLLRTVSSH
ncbi:MAG: hypothetical protein MZU84_00665 [Sphingobacterium sp.]|nr:hypothetical protein [Sphingobacterium sp.]